MARDIATKPNTETTQYSAGRTAFDPEAYVAAFNVDPRGFFSGWKRWKVSLDSVEPGLTKTGRKRFTIRFDLIGEDRG